MTTKTHDCWCVFDQQKNQGGTHSGRCGANRSGSTR
jgi:hypothetical protein